MTFTKIFLKDSWKTQLGKSATTGYVLTKTKKHLSEINHKHHSSGQDTKSICFDVNYKTRMSAFLLTARPQKYTEFNHLIVYQKQRVGLKCIKDLIKSINKRHETSVNTRRKQYNLQYPNQDFKFLPLALHRKTVKMSVVSLVDLYIPTDLFEIKITFYY